MKLHFQSLSVSCDNLGFVLSWGITAAKHLYLYELSVRKVSLFCDRGRLNFARFYLMRHLAGGCVDLKRSRFSDFAMWIPCPRTNTTLTVISSSSDEFTRLYENSKAEVSVAFRPPYLCPSKGHQHGVSVQSFINLDKTFSRVSRIWHCTHLILGEAICIIIVFHFSYSGLSVHGLHFIFLPVWDDSGNRAVYSELTQQGGEERRRQTLCNKRDNDFVWKNFY